MLTSIKKGLIATVLISNITFAGAMETVEFPCAPCSWSLGATALYLRPSFGGNGLGYSSFGNYGTNFFGSSVEVDGAPNHLSNVKPKQDWSFQLEGSFDISNQNDITVNWTHFNNATEHNLPQGTLFAGSASSLYAGLIIVTPSWDAVNVEVGQCIEFSDLLMRLHIGVEFANIQNKFKNYPQLTATGSPIFITKDKMQYTGFGPRVGGDFDYDLGCDFSFYAKGAAGLLAGRSKQTVSGYYDLGGFNLYSTGNYTQSNNSVVVTELEGKLGFTYDYQFNKSCLKLDLGYLWLTYLNSLVSQVGSGVVSSSISNSTAANFDLSGWYFGITWS